MLTQGRETGGTQGMGGSDPSFCTQVRGSEMLSLLQHNNVPGRKFDTNRTLFRGWEKVGWGERTSIHV